MKHSEDSYELVLIERRDDRWLTKCDEGGYYYEIPHAAITLHPELQAKVDAEIADWTDKDAFYPIEVRLQGNAVCVLLESKDWLQEEFPIWIDCTRLERIRWRLSQDPYAVGRKLEIAGGLQDGPSRLGTPSNTMLFDVQHEDEV